LGLYGEMVAKPRLLEPAKKGLTWCADDSCHFPTAIPTTTLQPGVLEKCCQRLFKCESSKDIVYYQNGLSATKHLVRDPNGNERNPTCPKCLEQSMCMEVDVFASENPYCAEEVLKTGPDFDCSMTARLGAKCVLTTSPPVVPPVALAQQAAPASSSGSSNSLSWLLAMLLVCCCLAVAAAGVGAAWAFFKPKKKSRMVQQYNHEMNGMHAESVRSQFDNPLHAPLSRSRNDMTTQQEYDLLTVSPDGYDLRPGNGNAPLAPPPAPLSPDMAMEPIQTPQVAPFMPAREPIQVPVVSPMQPTQWPQPQPMPQPMPLQQLQPQYVPEGRILRQSASVEPVAQAQPGRPIVLQSSTLQSSTAALQPSSSFVNQAVEVIRPPMPQIVQSQIIQPQIVQPQVMPLAAPAITPMPPLQPQPVPMAPQAPPQQPESEYDLVTLTPQGYEVKHLDNRGVMSPH